MANNTFLPYGRQLVDENDIKSVERVLKSDYLTTGSATDEFEARLAETTGAKYAICVSSGTAALHLSAVLLGLGPGDVVVVPTITFVATANVARHVGADVVFSDVDPETGLMRPEDLIHALKRAEGKARAVFPVHLAGQCADMSEIAEIAKRNKLAIVEDASHAIGTTHKIGDEKSMVGSCANSDMTIFSFHSVKTIAMGEGGAVTTNDKSFADRLKRLRSHGVERTSTSFKNVDLAFTEKGVPNPWYYEMQELGFNYRLSDIHCALGLSQLTKLDEFVSRRRHLVRLYDKAIKEMGLIIRPLGRSPDCDPAWHLYIALIDFGVANTTRARMMLNLRQLGIGTQVHYIPVHRQPYYKNANLLNLPGAETYYKKCLSLPLFPGMDDTDVERVCKGIQSLFSLD